MSLLNKKVPSKAILAILAVSALALSISACGDDGADAQRQEAQIRQHSYEHLSKEEPARTMQVSPTRSTINFWIDTWGKDPDKLSYVYLQAANGQLTGYYIFKGLPVSYCASLTPTYEFVGTPDDDSSKKNQMVPAPSVDGVYYSGGQCDAYYGRDASTGAYIEYTAGGSQNVLVYDRPLPRQNVEPLGFAVIDEFDK